MPMTRDQFENLEIMSRERATLAKKEAEHWLAEAEYWLTEADEWKHLKESADPFRERIANCLNDLAKANTH